MKKNLFLLLTAMILVSCSNDSDSPDNSFFNLNEGNLWVYKRYASNNGTNYTATAIIDSVRITGDTLINHLRYAKFVHKRYNSNVLYAVDKEYLRVDSDNHLVNADAFVYHPGTDIDYYNIRSVRVGGDEIVGWMGEQLLEPFTTNVEGVDYFVYSYYGIFSPVDNSFPNNYIFYEYKEGLGLVCQRCAGISGTYSTEDRLIYHELN